MQKFNGWRDADSFERWEAQSANSDREAIAKFNQREARLTKSQTVARRMFMGVMLILGILALWAIWGAQ